MAAGRQIIREVIPGSIAEEMEICAGDELLSVNGQPVEDVFDYRFLTQDEEIDVLIRKGDSGEEWLLEIEKEESEELGILFEEPLMDRYRSCHNRCIFCFIDQNPPGMRETLYFKDDDARLSFLQGNYVTLTNMRQKDIDRIIRYRMEPINISIHTTEPDLRTRMLGNRRAGEVLAYLGTFAEAGIGMNGQIVLCRGINDGDHLERTIADLSAYLPHLGSLSVVPAGLTRHREGLYPLEPFGKDEAKRVIEQVVSWQKRLYPKWKNHFIHASDEWYLLAGEPIPEAETYDGYPQLENGVGMLRLLEEEITEELADRAGDNRERSVSLACGMLPGVFLEEQMDRIRRLYPKVQIRCLPIRNDFYGERITVTGLVTGGDLIRQLQGRELGDRLLIPCQMLRAGEDVFLDNVAVKDVEKSLHIPVVIVGSEGQDLCRCILGEERQVHYRRRQMYEQDDRSDRGTPERR
ncbi:MAG: DUF512 domain-containing protein [Eubacterium sp.]|nr:DUF512 domain-containing protein [Eubacterium sp.]